MSDVKKVLFEVGGKLMDGLGNVHEDDAETRTVADLKAALDAKKVSYPASANKAALQSLADEHGV